MWAARENKLRARQGKTNCVGGKGKQIAWAARGKQIAWVERENKLRGRQGENKLRGRQGKTNCVDGKGKQIAWAAKVPYNINSQRLRAARYLPNCLGKTGGKVCGRQGQTNCVGDTSKNVVWVEQKKIVLCWAPQKQTYLVNGLGRLLPHNKHRSPPG